MILKNMASAIVPTFWSTNGIAFIQFVYSHIHTRIQVYPKMDFAFLLCPLTLEPSVLYLVEFLDNTPLV